MMKISCDLCGSELQMEAGGQSARCTVCGMVYSLERLREKMKISRRKNPAGKPFRPKRGRRSSPVNFLPPLATAKRNRWMPFGKK